MEKNTYESKSIRALIVTFSIPAILSLVVEIMTSVVDTVFAGHLGAASVNALTAMICSVKFPACHFTSGYLFYFQRKKAVFVRTIQIKSI